MCAFAIRDSTRPAIAIAVIARQTQKNLLFRTRTANGKSIYATYHYDVQMCTSYLLKRLSRIHFVDPRRHIAKPVVDFSPFYCGRSVFYYPWKVSTQNWAAFGSRAVHLPSGFSNLQIMGKVDKCAVVSRGEAKSSYEPWSALTCAPSPPPRHPPLQTWRFQIPNFVGNNIVAVGCSFQYPHQPTLTSFFVFFWECLRVIEVEAHAIYSRRCSLQSVLLTL